MFHRFSTRIFLVAVCLLSLCAAPSPAADCNTNGMPDEGELPQNDCDTNNTLDVCDVIQGAADCNTNGIPDHCALSVYDCNTNATLDECDTFGGQQDCNSNRVPDYCESLPAECRTHFLDLPLRRDFSFSSDGILYITAGSQVIRFDINTRTYLPPFDIGGNLLGIDLAPDGVTLAVADDTLLGSTTRIFLINRLTGVASALTFQGAFGEIGTYMVAWCSDGRLLIDSRFGGSGSVPLRRYDPILQTTAVLQTVHQDTMLSASATRDIIGLAQSNISTGPVSVYRVAAGAIVDTTNYNSSIKEVTVNRDGTRFIVSNSGSAKAFSFGNEFLTLLTLFNGPTTAAFSPVNNVLFTTNSGGSVTGPGVKAYYVRQGVAAIASLNNKHFPPGSFDFPFTNGRMRVSPDGHWLAAAEPGGVTLFDVSAFVTTPGQLNCNASMVPAGYESIGGDCNTNGTFDICEWPNIDCNTNNSNDVCEFAASPWTDCISNGTFDLCESIGPGCLHETLDIQDLKDFTFDSNGILYVTRQSAIWRYNTVTRTFLTPFVLQGTLNGIDLSQDGTTLAVADSSTQGTMNRVHLVDRNTGTYTSVSFTRLATEQGTYQVAWGSDGRLLVTSEGGVTTRLRRYDPVSDASTNLRSVESSTMLAPTANREFVAIAEPSSNAGPIHVYGVAAGDVVASTNFGVDVHDVCIDRQGSRLVVQAEGASARCYRFVGNQLILDAAVQGPIAAAFSPVNDSFYSSIRSEPGAIPGVRLYYYSQFPVPVAVLDNTAFPAIWNGVLPPSGRMKVSPDGRKLAVAEADALRIFDISAFTGVNGQLSCNTDVVPDGYQLIGADCNSNSIFDACELSGNDCNTNGTPDTCEIVGHDCNTNGLLDTCETIGGQMDCNTNMVPDSCEGPSLNCLTYTLNIPTRNDFAFDYTGTLYITSGSNLIRFNTNTKSYLPPFALQGMLNGIDLSPDGTTLAVTDLITQPGTNRIFLVNVSTGQYSIKSFPLAFGEGGTFQVAWGADQRLLITSRYNGSGSTPLRRYDPASDTVTVLQNVQTNTMLASSADRTIIGLAIGNINSGPVAAYNVSAGSIAAFFNVNESLYDLTVNSNGTRFAVPRNGHAWLLQFGGTAFTQTAFFQGPWRLAYSPRNEVMFAANWASGGESAGAKVYYVNPNPVLIASLDNTTFPNDDSGRMKVSPDGHWLVAALPSGVRLYDVSMFTALPGQFDCNTHVVPPGYESTGVDCNTNGTFDACEFDTQDCNTNITLDGCESTFHDCNSNLVLDTCEIDCNTNSTIDACEIVGRDCDSNGTLDVCELSGRDCNTNGTPDPCELPLSDCNTNSTVDACDLVPTSTGTATNPQQTLIADNATTASVINAVQRVFVTDVDVRVNIRHVTDSQLTIRLSRLGTTVLLASGIGGQGDNYTNTVFDQQAATPITASAAPFTGTFRPQGNLNRFNSLPKAGIWTLTVQDSAVGGTGTILNWTMTTTQRVIADCNTDGIPDMCQLIGADCDTNGSLDRCELPAADCNTNATLDHCDLAAGGFDCNTNSTLDACEPPITVCDGDLDHDGDIDGNDFALFLQAFGSSSGQPAFNPDADLDNDGSVTLVDYQLWLQLYFARQGGGGGALPRPSDVGDMNADGFIDGLDIALFTARLMNPQLLSFRDRFVMDCNADGMTDENDVPGFIALLLQ